MPDLTITLPLPPRELSPNQWPRILALDPGPTSTGWVDLHPTDGVLAHGHDDNYTVRQMLRDDIAHTHVACEQIASYGMAVGKDVFETCRWIGRFWELTEGIIHATWVPIERKAIKLHLCNSYRAKDANVRQALLDRFPATGGGKTPQIGTKARPGPLHGVSGHAWAALGVAVTCRDQLTQLEADHA
jgi:hypothetical protein